MPPEACNANWLYSPSFSAAIAFSVLFGVLTVTHIVLAGIYRKPFCWVIVMGVVWELTAFILRALGSHDQQNEAYGIAANILFLLAPLWINAFVYMTAGRLVYMLHPDKSIWRLKAMSVGKYFVWLDVFSFLVQGVGGLMLNPSSSANTQTIGKNIYMTGMGVQQLFILLFIAVIVRFHLDAVKLEQQGLLGSGHDGKRNSWWKLLTYTMYIVLVLITIRIIFRLVEFSGGINPDNNRLPFVEAYALGLDAVPMLIAAFLLAVVHPGTVLKGPESQFPSRKERKVERVARKAEKKEIKEAKKRGDYSGSDIEDRYLRTSGGNHGDV